MFIAHDQKNQLFIIILTGGVLNAQFIIEFITAAIYSITAFQSVYDDWSGFLSEMSAGIADHYLQILLRVSTDGRGCMIDQAVALVRREKMQIVV